MRITLRVIPSHSLPALPTLAILYATNTLEKNRENQMRKQPHFEKLFSPKMRFSPSRISPALPPAPNRSYSLRFPTSSHHLHHNRHEITTTFQRRSNDTSPTFQRNPFTTTRQFTPNHSNSYPIFIEYVPFYSRNSFTLPLYEHIRPQKEKESIPFIRLLPVMLFSSLLLQGFNLAITEKTCTEIDRIPIDFPPFTFARNVSFC